MRRRAGGGEQGDGASITDLAPTNIAEAIQYRKLDREIGWGGLNGSEM